MRRRAQDWSPGTAEVRPVRGLVASPSGRGANVLRLQRTAGNAAVAGLVAARSASATRAEEEDLPPGHEDSLAPGKPAPAQEKTMGAPPAPDLGPTIPDGEERAEDAAGGVQAQRFLGSGPPTTFPSYARILASPTVQVAVHKAWVETLTATTPTARREQGFWITWNNRWHTFSTSATGYGPVVGPAAGATINLPAKPPDQGHNYTVGSFHTHTPTTYRAVGRAVGPSGADVAADASDNVAGVVYDFWGNGSGNLPAGRSRLWPARLYHSGNSRRV